MNLKDEISLQTGDIILFSGNTWISRIIQYVGRSSYSHIGIILKNPRFLNLEDGIYLLESGYNPIPDSENHTIKYGVQIHLLDDVLKRCTKRSVFVRHVQCVRDEEFYERLSKVHSEIHDKPYDLNLFDWTNAEYNLFCPRSISKTFQITDRFWCSALVTYVLESLGLIEDVNWTLVAPREFGKGGSLKWKCHITDEELLF